MPSMNDYDLIKETISDYFEGYMTKDRARLEKAFCLGIATMVGYWKNAEGNHELFSSSIDDDIDEWVSPEHSTYGSGVGKIISMHIFSKDGATVTFDFGGRFIDTFQLVKIGGAWKIANKFFVDQ
jgi:hypothetical protein